MAEMTDKESLVLREITRNTALSQRDLAKITGISLGLINAILKKFIQSGFIHASHLNKRKMEYVLTPEGQAEAVQTAHRATTNTLQTYNAIQSRLVDLLKELHSTGYNYFSIFGDGELKKLVEATFRQCLEEAPVTLGCEAKDHPRAVVLNVTPVLKPDVRGDIVNVLEKLEGECLAGT